MNSHGCIDDLALGEGERLLEDLGAAVGAVQGDLHAPSLQIKYSVCVCVCDEFVVYHIHRSDLFQ